MTTQKYSRQREAIKANLRQRRDHPTADMVYADIRAQYPRVSLGTVYRNLALLTEQGEIRKLPSDEGADRYDGNLEAHNHFVCRECGAIFDIPPVDSKTLQKAAGKAVDGVIEESRVSFIGLCATCARAAV